MPLPADLRRHLSDPRFWAAYFFHQDGSGHARRADPLDVTAEFMVGGGHAIALDLNIALESFELGLLPPGAEKPLSVGWDDQAHWHPHVFRWDELDLVCRAVAMTEPRLRHPGPALALLCRYAFISDHDDIDMITPLVDAAFTAVRPVGRVGNGYWPTVRDWFDGRDLRDAGVTWHRNEHGDWSVCQEDALDVVVSLYSLRWTPPTPGDESAFPFTAWRAMLDQARRTLAAAVDPRWLAHPDVARLLSRVTTDADLTRAADLGRALAEAGCANPVIRDALVEPVHPAEVCWILELLTSAPQGSLVKALLGPSPLRSARLFRLSLVLDLADLPAARGGVIADDLDGALTVVGLGSADVAGGSSRREPDGRTTFLTTVININVRDDLEAGVRVIQQELRRHGALPGATLQRYDRSRSTIPWP